MHCRSAPATASPSGRTAAASASRQGCTLTGRSAGPITGPGCQHRHLLDDVLQFPHVPRKIITLEAGQSRLARLWLQPPAAAEEAQEMWRPGADVLRRSRRVGMCRGITSAGSADPGGTGRPPPPASGHAPWRRAAHPCGSFVSRPVAGIPRIQSPAAVWPAGRAAVRRSRRAAGCRGPPVRTGSACAPAHR